MEERFFRNRRLSALGLTLLLLVGCSLSRPSQPDSSTSADRPSSLNQSLKGTNVSFRHIRNQFIEVSGAIPDQKSGRFVVDPTINDSILFRDQAQKWKIGQDQDHPSDNGVQKKWIKNFSTGSFSKDHTFFVIAPRSNFPDLGSRYGKLLPRISGVLGHSFLQDLRVEFDFPNSTLTFRKTRQKNSADSPKWPIDFQVTQQPNNRKYLMVEGSINGSRSVNIVLDPSAPTNALESTRIDRFGLQKLSANALMKRFGPKSLQQTFVEVRRLWIFGRLHKNVLFKGVHGLGNAFGSRAFFVLGRQFLRDKIVRLDFARKNLQIQPASRQ